MMKRMLLVILLACAMILTLTACGEEDEMELSENSGPTVQYNTEEVTEENLFSEMQKNYTLMSLTDSWTTELTFQEDGRFEGTWHNDTEEGSSMYAFTGSFSQPAKIDDHKFSLKLDSAVVKSAEEAGETAEGTQYLETDIPEGFADTEDFYLFLPGTTVNEISKTASESSLFALGYSAADTLDCYVLVNPATQEAFAGTD